MTSLARPMWFALLALLVPAAGCSAVVAPDTNRLGGDGGAGADGGGVTPGTDGGVTPGTDGGNVTPGTDGGGVTPGTDAGAPILGNPGNCGPSGVRCGDLQLCVSGACVCRPPTTDIGGGNCVDLSSDPNNCGTPGNRCADRCARGMCITADCPSGTTNCDGACVDLRRDPANCGECGRTCNGRQICVGSCRDVTVPTGCTSCPCSTCGDLLCCSYPRLETPVCVEASTCP